MQITQIYEEVLPCSKQCSPCSKSAQLFQKVLTLFKECPIVPKSAHLVERVPNCFKKCSPLSKSAHVQFQRVLTYSSTKFTFVTRSAPPVPRSVNNLLNIFNSLVQVELYGNCFPVVFLPNVSMFCLNRIQCVQKCYVIKSKCHFKRFDDSG